MAYQDSTTAVNIFVHYEPGDLVVASSGRSPLERGVVYTVRLFVPPSPGEDHGGTVFLEGVEWGQNAEYVRLAAEEEIEGVQNGC